MGSEQGVWLCLVGVCEAMDGVTKRYMDVLERPQQGIAELPAHG